MRRINIYFLISSIHFLCIGSTQVDNECSCLNDYEVLDCKTTHFTHVEETNFIAPNDSKTKSWSQAKAHCESFGAQFAEIANYRDSYYLHYYIEDNPGEYWIGVIQRSHGKFSYSDGTTPITFSPPIATTRHGECIYATINNQSDAEDLIYGIADCHEQRKSFCQYSKWTRCYKTHDLEGLRDTFLPNSGMYISLEQKPWVEADYDCRRHGFHLITEVTQIDRKLNILISKLKDGASWQEIWTGGKFISSEYNSLKWSATNEIVEIGESMNDLWEPNEPREKSGSGLDLCLLLKTMGDTKSKVLWSVENCNLPKYYICKDGLTPSLEGKASKLGRALQGASSQSTPSKMEYCDKGVFVSNTFQKCSRSTVMCAKQPDCICFEGIHGLTDHNSCTPKLLIGSGCHKLVGNGSDDSHWKMLQNFDSSSAPFIIMQTRNPNSGNFIEWSKMAVGSKRQLFGPTTIFYSGLKMFKKGKKTYCTEPAATTGVKKVLTTELNAQISFNVKCEGSKTELPGEDADTTPRNECTLNCNANSGGNENETDVDPGNIFTNPSGIGTGTGSGTGGTGSGGNGDSNTEKEKQDALGLSMIRTAIDNAFDDHPNGSNPNPKPSRSFRILDKLFQITKHVCIESVPSDFLYRGLSLFKTLHSGKDYEYDEYFTEEETIKIEWILNKCMAEEEQALVQINNCTGQALYYEVHFPNGTYFKYPVEHKPVPQHHVPELTWNVVDVTNVACLRSFRSSYLLYHKLEQGMENLFTNEIRRLWHHPLISEDIYKKVLGADELTNLINLRACADAIYKRHNRVTPLERPKEPMNSELKPGEQGGGSTGTGGTGSGGTGTGDTGSGGTNTTGTTNNSTMTGMGGDKNVFMLCTPKSQCKISNS